MCVIIYIPKKSTIDFEEVKDAWDVNSDGAGFSVQIDGKVRFERGFMTLDEYWEAIKDYIGNNNIILHLRISTSNKVNRVQTHPYKVGNVALTKGKSKKAPVVCMNGVINDQIEYEECNDTMSYIIDHKETFMHPTQDIINIIEDATGAKWAVMTPNKIFLSKGFQEYDGRLYSNLNHRTYSYYKRFYMQKGINIHFGNKLKKQLKKNKDLYEEVENFVETYCRYGDCCSYCKKCLSDCYTIADIQNKINYDWLGLYQEYGGEPTWD